MNSLVNALVVNAFRFAAKLLWYFTLALFFFSFAIQKILTQRCCIQICTLPPQRNLIPRVYLCQSDMRLLVYLILLATC